MAFEAIAPIDLPSFAGGLMTPLGFASLRAPQPQGRLLRLPGAHPARCCESLQARAAARFRA